MQKGRKIWPNIRSPVHSQECSPDSYKKLPVSITKNKTDFVLLSSLGHINRDILLG